MRVPQNIPLCKVLKTRYMEADTNPNFGVVDSYVPVFVDVFSVNTDGDDLRVEYIALYAPKSYKNYEPPASYIIPDGYKAVNRQIDIAVSGTEKDIVSTGLGFIYVYKTNKVIVSAAPPYGRIYVIEIVKK